MINTYLENNKDVSHITTSQRQYRYKYFCIKLLIFNDVELSRFSRRLIYMTLTAVFEIYFISGWFEDLYSQTNVIRKIQPVKLEKNQICFMFFHVYNLSFFVCL